MDDLKISRFLAFAPELLARAREVAGASGRDGLLERLAIHIGDHQNAMAHMVDRDCRDHAAIFVEVYCRRCVLGYHRHRLCSRETSVASGIFISLDWSNQA